MIKFEEIVKDDEYRARVIKYFRLPMRLSASEEKFLSDLEFMRFLDDTYVNKVTQLTEVDFNAECKRQNINNPDFTMEYILEPIIEKISKNEKWIEFIKQDYSDILDDYEGITNVNDFYKKENNDKCFLSIDLVAANWQSLQHIIGFKESYENLIAKYTNYLIPPISKTMRTKITGLLNAKKIMDYNKKLLLDHKDKIIEIIEDNIGFQLNKKPFAFYADEFILEIDDNKLRQLYNINYNKIEIEVYEKTGIQIHFVPFKLKWLNLNKGCLKIYNNNNYEIINLSKDILLILNKTMNNYEIKDVDFEKIKNTQTLTEKIDNAIKIIEKSSKKRSFI